MVRDEHPTSPADVEAHDDTKRGVILKAARSPGVILKPATLLWDKLCAQIQHTAERHPEGLEFLEFVNHEMFFQDLCYYDHYGNWLMYPLLVGEKMEKLLQIAKYRRHCALRILNHRAEQLVEDRTQAIDEDAMKNVQRLEMGCGGLVEQQEPGRLLRSLR